MSAVPAADTSEVEDVETPGTVLSSAIVAVLIEAVGASLLLLAVAFSTWGVLVKKTP